MTLYAFVLFLHIVSVLLMFGALCLEALTLYEMRRALRVADARVWVGRAPAFHRMVAISGILVFATGIYLTIVTSVGAQAWLRIAVIAALFLAVLGIVAGRRARAIQAVIDVGMEDAVVMRRLRAQGLKMSLSIRVFITIGVVLLMVAQPGLLVSLVTITVALLLGVLGGTKVFDWAPMHAETN